MGKRIVSAVICLLLLTMVPLQSRAEGTVAWTFEETTGTLTITGTGMLSREMEAEWGDFDDQIRHLVMKEGITGIAPSMFAWMGLETIEFPDTLTEIGADVFFGCEDLTDVTIPVGVTSLGEGIFENCGSLASILVEDGNRFFRSEEGAVLSRDGTILMQVPSGRMGAYVIPETVTVIREEAFSTCSGLTEIVFPEGITSIGSRAFAYCHGLTEINVPDSVTEIGPEAFMNCSGVRNVTLPQGITVLEGGLFFACDGLEAVTIPDSVKRIGDSAFGACGNLRQTGLPEGVEVIGEEAYSSCTLLKAADLPDSLTTIGDFAFSGCSGLAWAEIPAGVTRIGAGAFGGCESLRGIAVREGNREFASADGILFSADKTRLLHFPMGYSETCSVPEGVTEIGPYAFWRCGTLTGITFPEGLTTIGAYAFESCTRLTEVILPEGVTAIGEAAFSNCVRLATVTLPDSIRSIGESAFVACEKMETMDLPEGITEISNYLFSGCESLKALEIPKSVTVIGDGALEACQALEEMEIPQGVTRIGAGAFGECIRLERITLPESVTVIGASAFDDCRALKQIQIPDGVTAIAEGTFCNCHVLRSVRLPDSVTEIGAGAFRSCFSLVDMNLPENLTVIGEFAFSDCCLNTVEIPGSVTEISAYAFWSCDKLRSVTLGEGVSAIGDHAFGVCELLGTVQLPNSVSTIGAYAFTDTPLAGIRIPKGVTDIGAYAFSECTSLKTVIFLGDAPAFGELVFERTSPEICYSEKAPGWTEAVRRSVGEGLVWTPYGDQPPRLPGTLRVAGDNRFLTAFAVAEQMKRELHTDTFEAIIVASGTSFADALSGSYLAAVKNAPILLSCTKDFHAGLADRYNEMVSGYIRENLQEGGTVYILGGPKAVDASLEERLMGWNVKRLAGSNRYETNIRILEEAGVDGREVLVCNGEGFADSLSASAAERPILLVNSRFGLFDLQKSFLEQCGGSFCIIGGTSAVSQAAAEQLEVYGTTRRLGGKNRFETSVLIAQTFFDAPDGVVLAYGMNFPDGLCGGALAAAMDAPLILTMSGYASSAGAYVQEREIRAGLVLGTDELISDATAQHIFEGK